MQLTLSIAFIILFCIDYYYVYNNTTKKYTDLTEKQRAYIMSIKASITMFLLSLYFNYKFINSNCNFDIYLNSLNNNDYFILNIGILHLISFFLVDGYMGFNDYHKYMCSLAGYTHHIVYTLGSIGILVSGAEPLAFYFLYFIEEISTVFLSSGQYNKLFRTDQIFGFVFFITRIIYHSFLTWSFRHNTMAIIGGGLTLCLHMYWFKNWVSKYFLKSNKVETKVETKVKEKVKEKVKKVIKKNVKKQIKEKVKKEVKK